MSASCENELRTRSMRRVHVHDGAAAVRLVRVGQVRAAAVGPHVDRLVQRLALRLYEVGDVQVSLRRGVRSGELVEVRLVELLLAEVSRGESLRRRVVQRSRLTSSPTLRPLTSST